MKIAAFRDVQAKTAVYSSKKSAQSAALMEECANDPEVCCPLFPFVYQCGVAQDTAFTLPGPNLRLVLAETLDDTSLTWHVACVADKPSTFASVGCAGQGDQAETDAIKPKVGSPDGQH
jgi:hypothetical protein